MAPPLGAVAKPVVVHPKRSVLPISAG